MNATKLCYDIITMVVGSVEYFHTRIAIAIPFSNIYGCIFISNPWYDFDNLIDMKDLLDINIILCSTCITYSQLLLRTSLQWRILSLKIFFNTWLSWTIIIVKWYCEFFFSVSIKWLLLIDNWKKYCIFRSLRTDVNYRWDTNARYTDRSDQLLIGSMSS